MVQGHEDLLHVINKLEYIVHIQVKAPTDGVDEWSPERVGNDSQEIRQHQQNEDFASFLRWDTARIVVRPEAKYG